MSFGRPLASWNFYSWRAYPWIRFLLEFEILYLAILAQVFFEILIFKA